MGDAPRPEPLYRPQDDGTIVVYVGDLVVGGEDGSTSTVRGQLELTFSPRSTLTAHFAGSFSTVGRASWLSAGHERGVTIPEGASLAPPSERLSFERPDGERSWVDDQIWPESITAGELDRAERFMFHLSSGFEPEFRVQRGVSKAGINFELPGWTLVAAATTDERRADESDFGGVVEAVPTEAPTQEGIERLRNRLYVLLSLAAGREIGIAPVCGLDAKGTVVWGEWGAPRLRLGKSTAWWCPPLLIPAVLPELARGYVPIVEDRALEPVAHRALDHLLAADSPEVLDVRIPVACSGLELLSWGVLRRHGWLDQDSFQQLTAAAKTRLLLQWAEIPTAIPENFHALIARRDRLQQTHGEAPEILFNVRNGLIHPPRRLDDPEWPTLDELIEAWQFSTWALQLALLRLLGYADHYWSRLRLGRSALSVEPVPWAAEA